MARRKYANPRSPTRKETQRRARGRREKQGGFSLRRTALMGFEILYDLAIWRKAGLENEHAGASGHFDARAETVTLLGRFDDPAADLVGDVAESEMRRRR